MMTVLLSAAFFTIGLYLTMRGGDGFVDAAAQLAEESGAPRFVVGATLMSVCTTLPELWFRCWQPCGARLRLLSAMRSVRLPAIPD